MGLGSDYNITNQFSVFRMPRQQVSALRALLGGRQIWSQ